MSVHEDTLQGLNEALDYACGNIQLKATTVEMPDEEVTIESAEQETKSKDKGAR